VRHVGRDRPGLPGPEHPRLVSDAEGQRAGDDDPELLVLVLVFGNDRVWVELDDGERLPLAVHRARDNGLPDLDHGQVLQIVERSQAATLFEEKRHS
jgi:hypothetical protein